MLNTLVRRVVGSKNDREIKRMRKTVARINALEESIGALSDNELQQQTARFRERLAGGESLDRMLPEAFATVREATRRVMGMRQFDVQMIGAMALNDGRIAEMKTGEGKTLVATLAVYLNALPALGVHVVTVNDYLARRDADWMRPLYEYLGLSVGVIFSGQQPPDKRAAYACDITYGTNNEYGFDYLRDNMAFSLNDKVQRQLNYAIIDEVDSILIDEARTPLIISGPVDENVEIYRTIDRLIQGLVPSEDPEDPETGDFTLDEKQKQVELTERGHHAIENIMREANMLGEDESLYAAHNLGLLHHVNAALRARHLFHRDVDYVVTQGEVIIVDEHTGRTMHGRRWSEGLHQAVEAKENVEVQKESQTLASTTFQNYFRLYDKLAGMTGTADTEAFEFRQTYNIDVLVVPTNRPRARKDLNDLVYMTTTEKFEAIIEDVKARRAEGRPVLVGTASIESSEVLSAMLRKQKIEHSVLNAKQHDSEAEIIAQAGRPGAITIATNMAGRGTDIVLGGNWESEVAALDNPDQATVEAIRADWQKRHDAVIEAGGLHVVGSERHESRRIDNQLRGRAGRQGDPGSTRFFLSLEDNLMRLFGSERVQKMMGVLGLEHGEAIEHKMVSNAVERAQRKVEGRNFDMRKQLLEYDDVANDQRKVVYNQRNGILASEDVSENVRELRVEMLDDSISSFVPPQSLAEQWDLPGLEEHLRQEFNLEAPVVEWAQADEQFHEELLRERLQDQLRMAWAAKEEAVGSQTMRRFEKQVMLQVLDTRWKEHLQSMDHLRRGIHLRGYAQKNPKQEYKRESFELFQTLLHNVKSDVVRILSHVQVRQQADAESLERERRESLRREQEASEMTRRDNARGDVPASGLSEEAVAAARAVENPTVRREQPKVGRNEACPCGSGRKYKHCHGSLDQKA